MPVTKADQGSEADTQHPGSTEEVKRGDFRGEVALGPGRAGHDAAVVPEDGGTLGSRQCWHRQLSCHLSCHLSYRPPLTPPPSTTESSQQQTPELLPTYPRTSSSIFVLSFQETSSTHHSYPRASGLWVGKAVVATPAPEEGEGERSRPGLGRGHRWARRARPEIEEQLTQTSYVILKRQLSSGKIIYLL